MLPSEKQTVTVEVRADVASYYDLNPHAPTDIPFYDALIPSSRARVLELGCGTGRVLVPLAERARRIQGIDTSEGMLAICRQKLRSSRIPASQAQVAIGNICDFNLGRTFDLIIAPYRVIQNIETDAELRGLFSCIKRHLSPSGTCILNVFRPKLEVADLCQNWATNREAFQWEVAVEGGRVTCHDKRARIDCDRLILYPELIWRKYEGDTLVDEVTLMIPMRCYYPKKFCKLIVEQGFQIINRWGGYAGEDYGVGPELIVQFQCAA